MGNDIVNYNDYVIYNDSFEKIELPRTSYGYGVRGESIDIGNTPQDVTTEKIGDRTFVKSIENGEKEISLTLQIFGKTRHDYEMWERKLFKFFRQLGEFYVAKGTASNILYKVILNGKIVIEKVNYIVPYSQAKITLKKVDIDYGISRFTTMDLHQNKVKFDGKWSLGMNLEEAASGKNLRYNFYNTDELTFYNASDVGFKNINQDEFKIHIWILEDTPKLTLYDDSGNTFIYNNKENPQHNLVKGDKIEIHKTKIMLNGNNVIGRTNKVFLETKVGLNKFQILEDFKYQIQFDFRFIYE